MYANIVSSWSGLEKLPFPFRNNDAPKLTVAVCAGKVSDLLMALRVLCVDDL